MLTFEYGPIRCGGLATMVTSLCGAIDKSRFEPVVVLPRSEYSPPWRLVAQRSLPSCDADIYRHEGSEIWLLSNSHLRGPIYPYAVTPDEASLRATQQKIDNYGECVSSLLSELRVDAVHLHDAFAYRGLPTLRQWGLPSALTIHRLHDDIPFMAHAERVAAPLVDELTTVSRSYLEEHPDFFRLCERTRAIPNGLETDFWSEACLPPAAGGRPERLSGLCSRLGLPPGPTFAYVGRLDTAQKGLGVLLRAHARHLSGAGLNLIFAGEGDPELAREISATVEAAPRGNVRFIHRLLSREEVRELLGAVDFAVIPSRFEPFGLVQLEAMAMGALPISSRVGGLKDVLVELHGQQGFGRLFAVGDHEALAAAMRELARLTQRPEELERARQAARACAQRYSARAMAEQYEQLYTSLMERALHLAKLPAAPAEEHQAHPRRH